MHGCVVRARVARRAHHAALLAPASFFRCTRINLRLPHIIPQSAPRDCEKPKTDRRNPSSRSADARYRPERFLFRNCRFRKSPQRAAHLIDHSALRHVVALRQIRRIIVAKPDLTGRVFPRERLQRQVDAGALRAFPERRTALRISKNKEFGGPQRLSHLCSARPPHAEVMSATINAAYRPVSRDTSATSAKAIASGTMASATVRPLSRFVFISRALSEDNHCLQTKARARQACGHQAESGEALSNQVQRDAPCAGKAVKRGKQDWKTTLGARAVSARSTGL